MALVISITKYKDKRIPPSHHVTTDANSLIHTLMTLVFRFSRTFVSEQELLLLFYKPKNVRYFFGQPTVYPARCMCGLRVFHCLGRL